MSYFTKELLYKEVTLHRSYFTNESLWQAGDAARGRVYGVGVLFAERIVESTRLIEVFVKQVTKIRTRVRVLARIP